MPLTYTILGTGALGGYYGGQLARAGQRVNFLLHSDYDHVQAHGLRIDLAPTDDTYTLKPNTHNVGFYQSPADLPAADVVLVCLKTTQNHRLPELLPPNLVHDDTLVVTLQNGLHPERDVAHVVGEPRTAGGLCFLCSNKLGPGHIAFIDYGFIKLGAHPPRPSQRMIEQLEQIATDFRAAHVDCNTVTDLVLARWQKLVWNVPYNGLSVVLNMTTDRMMADPDIRQRIVALMHEVAAAAKAVDSKTIDEAFIETMLNNTSKMAPYKTSMMLDYEAGRPMETQTILGDPVAAADAHGASIPRMRRLHQELLALASVNLALEHRTLERFAFGDSPDMADELLALVLAGTKRATCHAAREGERIPPVGQQSVVLDGRGKPMCVIETESAEIKPFNEVDADFAAAEGEGDRTLDTWRSEHRSFVIRQGEFKPDMRLVCERFCVVARLTEID